MNRLLQRAKEGKPSYGIFITMVDSKLVELAAYAGFDFIRIDCEHSMIDYTAVGNLIRTAKLLDLHVLVRTPNSADITKLLDHGADGIIFPDIKTKEQAQQIVDLVKFAPLGQRGISTNARNTRFGDIPINEYVKTANDEISLTVQIESREAFDNLDDILSVKGIDMIASGRNDLSQSMGFLGQASHPEVMEAEATIVRKTLACGKVPTMLANSPKRTKELQQMGVYVSVLATDTGIILKGWKNFLSEYK